MPKISSTGEPSYADHQGTVTNAVGEQFEVDPTRELDGERKDGYVNEPVGDFESEPAPGTAGPIAPITDDGDETGNAREGRTEDGRDNDQRPRLVDQRQSEGQQQEQAGKTAAKKSAPPATKK